MPPTSLPRVSDLDDLVAGPPDPELDPRGTPTRALVAYDLEAAAELDDDELAAAARHAAHALPVLIGVAHSDLPARLGPLLDALDLTLTSRPEGRLATACPGSTSVDEAVATLAARAAATPRAAMTSALLLRQGERLAVWSGLVAESAAYSALLAGPEFAAWLATRGPSRPATGAPGGATGAPSGPVQLHRDGDVLHVRLARPGRRNAVDTMTRDALVEAFDLALADTSVKVHVSGEGPDFCAGGDLDDFGSAPDPATAHLIRLAQSVGWRIHQCRERTSVRVHGACLGAGLELPAFAARLVATPSARFGLPELGLGLLPGAGGTVSVVRRIGRWRTAYLLLSGRVLDAPEALAWGLIDAIED